MFRSTHKASLQGETSSFKLIHSGSDHIFFVIFVFQELRMYPDHKLVLKCLLQIEESLGWGASEKWHNDVFVELSERIQKETKVLLSPVTLKRVWGRIDYKSAPSITTLNTLAQFAGFQNWREFKGSVSDKKPSYLARKVGANLGVITLSASIMTIIFISFYSLKGTQPKQDIDLSKIVFKSRPIAMGLPNSVVFELDLDNIKSDSIHIQQYWDPTKTIALTPGQKKATGQYYNPGYFRAKLMVDGEAIKQHDLFIKTEGWLGTVNYHPIPKYIPSSEIVSDKLAFSKAVLDEIANREQPTYSTFHYVDDFDDVSGDNFKLSSTLRNAYQDKWAVCQKAAIMVLGTKGAMVISFSIPGCVSEIGVMMNDTYMSGKEHDLSGLGLDFTEPVDIEIEVREKQLRVFSEKRELFTGKYNETVGRIVGLRYRFLGAGEVFSYKLSNLSSDIILDSSQMGLP